MTTFSWNCTNVEVLLTEENYNNVVYNVNWVLTGTSDQLDGESNPYTSSLNGWQMLNTDNITEFVPFADLTNAIVTQWVKDAMGPTQVALLESNIENAINVKINPITAEMTIGA
jgi:hypothetical protein